MSPLTFLTQVLAISVSAGLLGSLLGLGGGIILVPALTLLMKVDIRFAIGASIVSVIATSSGAAISYIRDEVVNLRLGMVLELATVSGAIMGASIANFVSGSWLYIAFAAVMAYSAISMFRKNRDTSLEMASDPPPSDPLADRLKLHGKYRISSNAQIEYFVCRTKLGAFFSMIAGVMSGLLGIGGGVLKVPVMHLLMGVPLKSATATSNFMIGVTAAASAGIYFSRGQINPFITAPVAIGVLVGASIGARLLHRVKSAWIRAAFVLILVWTSTQMLRKGMVLHG